MLPLYVSQIFNVVCNLCSPTVLLCYIPGSTVHSGKTDHTPVFSHRTSNDIGALDLILVAPGRQSAESAHSKCMIREAIMICVSTHNVLYMHLWQFSDCVSSGTPVALSYRSYSSV